MDEDSSTKFIGSLTKFLQSLCNGYVEFQRGVELVGHIYLNIDTGEKVDYILHEKVSKNDENSVSFVSNSFHAQPIDKNAKTASKDAPSKSGTGGSEQGSDDDDIVIVGQSEWMPGSTNSGTIPSRGLKRSASSSSEQKQIQHAGVRSRGSSSPMSSQAKYRQHSGGPAAATTNQGVQQDNINIGDVKLEQISTDELLSLASQVNEGASSSHVPPVAGQHNQTGQGSHSVDNAAGQPMWIKQEMPDDSQPHGGHDTGWPRSRDGQSDSSNSGSDLYPVMMHQSSAYSSGPVFPGFSSHQSSVVGSHHGQSLPGMSGAANMYTNPMPGTSQGMSSIDPAAVLQHLPVSACGLRDTGSNWATSQENRARKEKNRLSKRLSRQRIKGNPILLKQYRERERLYARRYKERQQMSQLLKFETNYSQS